MDYINWDKNLQTGIDSIDAQHKTLVNILNEVYAAFIEERSDMQLKETLKRLKDYSEYHFKTEEQFFEVYNYPEKVEHIQEHRRFKEQLDVFSEKIENNKSITHELVLFLTNWVKDHILLTDMNYTAFLNEHHIK